MIGAIEDVRLRLLVFVQSLGGGGVQQTASTLSRLWAEAGHEVLFLTMTDQTNDVFRLDPRVERVVLPELAVSNPSIWRRLVGKWRRLLALRREIRRFSPDAAIAMSAMHNVEIGLASLGLQCRTVGCNFGVPAHHWRGFIKKLIYRYGYRLLDAVTAETRPVVQWLQRETWARRSIVVPKSVQWPIPETDPTVPPDFCCKPGRKFILAAGRFSAEKDFHSLLYAFAAACRHRPDWDLVILGEGPERPALESRRKELELDTRVFLPGWAGNIGAWYERASIFALTSLHEGGPNVLIEAMAYGVPAVAFDCDEGPREIIRHEVDGFLVPPGNMSEFVRALSRLMDDDALRLQMSRRAVETRDRFSEADVIRKWDALFDTIGHRKTPSE